MKGNIVLDGWAGITRHPVEILKETPKRYRVKLQEDIRMPGKRYKKAGDVVLVPKDAVEVI